MAFYGLLLLGGILDTTAYIKRRVWRSNGVCGGVLIWGVRVVYSCPVFLRFFGLIGEA